MEEELKILAEFIRNWCEAIDKNGTSWDDWDEYYKDAYYRDNTKVYQILRKYTKFEKEEEK